ncbi:MAG: flagellar type III secretion system pore protein FliP [Gammaproteobacteria bacterium]
MKAWIAKYKYFIVFLFVLLPISNVYADVQTIPLVVSKQAGNTVTYDLSIKILMLMAVLSVLPALLITMTAFTRITIVLAILRQAIGIPNVPSNQILIGLSLIMTLFVMTPVIQKVNDVSLQPYIQGKLTEQQALDTTGTLIKTFMLKQTRKVDLKVFVDLSHTTVLNNDYPLLVVMPAYITSELKTAFEIGFLIFLPFLILDLVIASILMSMGMMMLSPMVISLPFKLLFFVLVDGWSLVVTSLITSFRI